MIVSEAEKERVKIRATYLNNIGVGFAIGAGVTTSIAVLSDGAVQPADDIRIGLAVLFAVISALLHFGAMLVLGGLDR